MLYFKHHIVYLLNFVQFSSNENMTQKAYIKNYCASPSNTAVFSSFWMNQRFERIMWTNDSAAHS